MTRQLLRKLLNDGDVGMSAVTKFYTAVRTFYTTSVEYVKKVYPLKDDVLMHSKFINIEREMSVVLTQSNTFCIGTPI